MKKLKTAFVLLSTLVMSLALVACSSSNNRVSGSSDALDIKRIEIVSSESNDVIKSFDDEKTIREILNHFPITEDADADIDVPSDIVPKFEYVFYSNETILAGQTIDDVSLEENMRFIIFENAPYVQLKVKLLDDVGLSKMNMFYKISESDMNFLLSTPTK